MSPHGIGGSLGVARRDGLDDRPMSGKTATVRRRAMGRVRVLDQVFGTWADPFASAPRVPW